MVKLGKFINDAWVQTLDISFEDREKDCEVVTVEFIQPILRSNPDKTAFVLGNTERIALRKPLFNSVTTE
jgi:hypothetical protein